MKEFRIWIELDRQVLVYAPGERLKGNLIVENKKKLKINNLFLYLKGNILVYWYK